MWCGVVTACWIPILCIDYQAVAAVLTEKVTIATEGTAVPCGSSALQLAVGPLLHVH